MRQSGFHLVHQNQAQLAGLQRIHGSVDRQKLTINLVLAGGHCGTGQPFAQQGHDLAIAATPLALVFVHHHLFKCRAQDLGDLADVLITPVTGTADHHRAAARWHGLDRMDQRHHGVGVVPVVGNHGGTPVAKNIEAAGRVVQVGAKTGQAGAQSSPVQTQSPDCSHAGHHVFHLEANLAAMRDRNFGEIQKMLVRPFSGDDLPVVHVDNRATLGAVRRHHRVELVYRKKGHVALALGRHGSHYRIGRVQHRHALRRDVLHDHPLEHRQLVHGGDVVQTQMVATAHVGHHRDIAVVKGQAFAQHATTGSFQHGRIDVRVVKHVACALGAAAVAGIDAMAAHVHTVGVGHAHAPTLLRQQMRD